MRADKVILYPMMTEKAISLIESQNTISFVVEPLSTKDDVKAAVEKLYNVKVASIRSCVMPRGKKKVYVKLREDFKASDLAIKLGLL